MAVVRKEEKVVARESTVRTRISSLLTTLDSQYIELSQLMFEAHEKAYYVNWGYTSFREYCAKELSMQHRKAWYYVSIARAVRDSGVKWDDVTGIGWTNMRSVARVITNRNANEWLDRARNMTAEDLDKSVRDYLATGNATPDKEDKSVVFRVKLTEDEASVVFEAVGLAKDMLNTESATIALQHICYDWIQQSEAGPKQMTLETIQRMAERVYGVKLEPVGGQDLGKLIQVEGVA